MRRPSLPRPVAALPIAFALVGCTNYQDQLARAEQHYQNARYEAALVNLEDLEIHTPALSRGERVRYDVVRGMTHLRLEQRPDARHWLALAREEARTEPSAMTETTRANIDRTVEELDPLAPAVTAATVGDGGTGASNSSGGSTTTAP
jgi:hypothetical protein